MFGWHRNRGTYTLVSLSSMQWQLYPPYLNIHVKKWSKIISNVSKHALKSQGFNKQYIKVISKPCWKPDTPSLNLRWTLDLYFVISLAMSGQMLTVESWSREHAGHWYCFVVLSSLCKYFCICIFLINQGLLCLAFISYNLYIPVSWYFLLGFIIFFFHMQYILEE